MLFDDVAIRKVEAFAELLIKNPNDQSVFEELNQLIFAKCNLTEGEISAITELYDSRFSSKEESDTTEDETDVA